jgi:hypothetical protein
MGTTLPFDASLSSSTCDSIRTPSIRCNPIFPIFATPALSLSLPLILTYSSCNSAAIHTQHNPHNHLSTSATHTLITQAQIQNTNDINNDTTPSTTNIHPIKNLNYNNKPQLHLQHNWKGELTNWRPLLYKPRQTTHTQSLRPQHKVNVVQNIGPCGISYLVYTVFNTTTTHTTTTNPTLTTRTTTHQHNRVSHTKTCNTTTNQQQHIQSNTITHSRATSQASVGMQRALCAQVPHSKDVSCTGSNNFALTMTSVYWLRHMAQKAKPRHTQYHKTPRHSGLTRTRLQQG